MRNGPLLFLGFFITVALSWGGIVWFNNYQYGNLEPHFDEMIDQHFPAVLGGVAKRGKQVYMDLGCMYCHTQQVRRPGYGVDQERGWGDRQSVARDYVGERTVLLGTMRTGPDLMTIGQREPSEEWHHLHLYNPRITSPGSIMPPFGFLYTQRRIVGERSARALDLPSEYAPPEGYEIVPTPRAEALVAYLLSRKMDYDLPEATRDE